jgi:hypothetical protein
MKRRVAKKNKRRLKPGQPSAHSFLNDEIERKLCARLEKGSPISLACDLCRISRSAFYEWERLGAASDDPSNRYHRFADRIRQAKAAGAYVLHEEVRRVDAKWLLARVYPDAYPDPTQRTEVTGAGGAPLLRANPFQVEIKLAEGEYQTDWDVHQSDGSIERIHFDPYEIGKQREGANGGGKNGSS